MLKIVCQDVHLVTESDFQTRYSDRPAAEPCRRVERRTPAASLLARSRSASHSLSLATPLLAIADAARFATATRLRRRAVGQSISTITTSSSTQPLGPLALLP